MTTRTNRCEPDPTSRTTDGISAVAVLLAAAGVSHPLPGNRRTPRSSRSATTIAALPE